jgi:hypothetical protein
MQGQAGRNDTSRCNVERFMQPIVSRIVDATPAQCQQTATGDEPAIRCVSKRLSAAAAAAHISRRMWCCTPKVLEFLLVWRCELSAKDEQVVFV